jgi:hypothetical protein
MTLRRIEFYLTGKTSPLQHPYEAVMILNPAITLDLVSLAVCIPTNGCGTLMVQ